MGLNTTWDEWATQHLILDERLSNFSRYVKNFVMAGFGLANGGGLTVLVGQVGLNVAYINGYEIKQTGAQSKALTDNIVNHVFLKFVKTADPTAGTSAITISIEVNTTGTAPANSLKLGTVTTLAGVVTTIVEQNNKLALHDFQFETDGDANQKQLKRLVIHSGTAFPTVPAPIAGELFVRTDQVGNPMYRFDGTGWVTLGALPTNANKDEASLVTAGDDSTTGIVIAETPVQGSYVRVSVNGLGVRLGDGVKTKDAYFSGDGGVTARAFANIAAGDVLFWNGVLAGYDLAAADSVDMEYSVS